MRCELEVEELHLQGALAGGARLKGRAGCMFGEAVLHTGCLFKCKRKKCPLRIGRSEGMAGGKADTQPLECGGNAISAKEGRCTTYAQTMRSLLSDASTCRRVPSAL
jgi:hypothetical protein